MAETLAARSGHAFGLWLDSEFDIPGLDGGAPARRLPRCTLRLADSRDVDRRWAGVESHRLLAEEGEPGAPARTIDFNEELGYRLFARYFGESVVSGDGASIDCLPPPVRTWRWQRFLVGRALPLAALLRGYETFHASAVAFDDEVVAIVGPSGWGKSSLAVSMVLQSDARFVTDDVLTLSEHDGRHLAHPGIGVTNVRLAEEQRLGDDVARLGPLLGTTGRQKSHYGIERETAPLPLTRMYMLVPGTGARATIDPIEADPRLLLGNAFVVTGRGPDRLASLLRVSASIARSVEMFQVGRGSEEGPAELAERLIAHFGAP